MQTDFVIFESFPDRENAQDLILLLEGCGIEYETDEISRQKDTVYIGGMEEKQFQVLVREQDVDRINQLLEEEAISRSQTSPPPYFASFTDEELMEILQKPDEWSREDYYFALRLLKEKDKAPSKETLQNWKVKRQSEVTAQDKAGTALIITGYILSVILPVFGLGIGLFLRLSKNRIRGGKSVYVYDHASRKAGLLMISLSVAVIAVALILRMISGSSDPYLPFGW